MRKLILLVMALGIAAAAPGQDRGSLSARLPLLDGLTQPQDYIQKRSSSYDRMGGNADYREVTPGETL